MSGELQCPCQTNWTTGEYHDSKCPEAKKLRDSWLTPTDVVERLPEVDIDPATNIRSLVKAKRHIVWEHDPTLNLITPLTIRRSPGWELGDGLRVQWSGSAFLNGPYSDMLPFADKANEEWGARRLTSALFLVKLDPTTQWWRQLVRPTPDRVLHVWLFKSRLRHVPPPRIKASTNNFASALIHWMKRGAKPVPFGDIAQLYVQP